MHFWQHSGLSSSGFKQVPRDWTYYLNVEHHVKSVFWNVCVSFCNEIVDCFIFLENWAMYLNPPKLFYIICRKYNCHVLTGLILFHLELSNIKRKTFLVKEGLYLTLITSCMFFRYKNTLSQYFNIILLPCLCWRVAAQLDICSFIKKFSPHLYNCLFSCKPMLRYFTEKNQTKLRLFIYYLIHCILVDLLASTFAWDVGFTSSLLFFLMNNPVSKHRRSWLTPHYVASDLGMHRLPMVLLRVFR